MNLPNDLRSAQRTMEALRILANNPSSWRLNAGAHRPVPMSRGLGAGQPMPVGGGFVGGGMDRRPGGMTGAWGSSGGTANQDVYASARQGAYGGTGDINSPGGVARRVAAHQDPNDRGGVLNRLLGGGQGGYGLGR